MAHTWQGASAEGLPANYSQAAAEGPAPDIQYEVKRVGEILHFQAQMPGGPRLDYPLEASVGGQRHGISFLLRVPALDGLPVTPSRLVEARYFHYAQQNKLAFS